jgi:hypothetical protein
VSPIQTCYKYRQQIDTTPFKPQHCHCAGNLVLIRPIEVSSAGAFWNFVARQLPELRHDAFICFHRQRKNTIPLSISESSPTFQTLLQLHVGFNEQATKDASKDNLLPVDALSEVSCFL